MQGQDDDTDHQGQGTPDSRPPGSPPNTTIQGRHCRPWSGVRDNQSRAKERPPEGQYLTMVRDPGTTVRYPFTS